MVFEFQHETVDGTWESLGAAATPGTRFDIEEAAVALRDLRGGHLPSGPYRVRAAELQPDHWHLAEVDEHGVFRRVER